MTNNHPSKTQPVTVGKKKPIRLFIFGSCIGLIFVLIFTMIGGFAGYRSARQEIERAELLADFQLLQEQLLLGLRDYNQGEFELARQRFEYILARDPNFPGVADRLVDTLRILYATSTPTSIPPTPTLTPTQDMRPVEELFLASVNYYNVSDWSNTIDTLIALRKEDPMYRVVEVDSLFFRSLRNRGIQKIQAESNLEGGIYDLALAERFGPIDDEAMSWRNLARIYMIGLGFWEAYPEQAVYYFGQVASAAPYLRDASGWTASARYRGALLQFADQLARDGDWCEAELQYQKALSYGADERVQATAMYVQIQCSPPTGTPTLTQTFTQTPTSTLSGTSVMTVIPTDTLTPTTVSQTPSPTTNQTVQPTVTITPTESPSSTSPPVMTPTQTETPQPSPTSTPSPTSG